MRAGTRLDQVDLTRADVDNDTDTDIDTEQPWCSICMEHDLRPRSRFRYLVSKKSRCVSISCCSRRLSNLFSKARGDHPLKN